MAGTKKLTPMMAQYMTMRRSLPDDILLLYRLGDFYEMFFEDAKMAAGILNVALTKRNEIPMCGVPHHAAQGYIAKLIKANKRVAIAEQTTAPEPGKIVEREIAQIISASTVDDLSLLDDTRHNYLAAVYQGGTAKKPTYGLAYTDHTTGEFTVAEFNDLQQLEDELTRIRPSELLISDHQISQLGHLLNHLPYDSYCFLIDQALHLLKEQFKVQSLDGFGCSEMPSALSAAGGILHYLTYQLRRKCDHLRSISVRQASDYVLIDSSSQLNLDLVESRSGKQHTLVGVLDRTSTPMGARKLRDWILHPLRDLEALNARLDLVESFLAEPYLLTKIQDSLKQIRDIERTTGRLSQGSGNARDLKSLQFSLERIPDLKADLSAISSTSGLSEKLLTSIQEFPALVTLLNQALVDEPPAQIRDGGIIRDGHCSALDELRDASRSGKQWIAELQQTERERTGIDSLKIKFNNVFGYFIELTKNHADKAPDDYQRKQTMANAERFITPALKEVEGKVLGADDRAKALEHEEFIKLRNEVSDYLSPLQTTADALATIDVLISFAQTAQLYQHSRPIIDHSQHLEITGGRHPILEQTLIDEKFVPNDTLIEPAQSLLQILTGPNMAGKSTYIRQVALITLMAQIGAYVPAQYAHIGLTDRIFCRVGASDDLSKGQSTFMVEMNETSLIVNNATDQSLVILDEIGRGTATFDGLSIAWSVAEHLHDQVRCRTLFATHYHELCALADNRDSVANFNVAVREWNDDIIFLRKILPGQADKSYGIQVARLAGIPTPILERAKEILSHLEMSSSKPQREGSKTPKAKKVLPDAHSPQLDLFD